MLQRITAYTILQIEHLEFIAVYFTGAGLKRSDRGIGEAHRPLVVASGSERLRSVLDVADE